MMDGPLGMGSQLRHVSNENMELETLETVVETTKFGMIRVSNIGLVTSYGGPL